MNKAGKIPTMNIRTNLKSWYRKVTFEGLSIEQRLPLLICVLLCSIILTFSFASFYGVKKAAIDTGKHRLRTLTDQLATLLSQSSQTLNNNILAAAQHEAVKKNILSGGTEFKNEALTAIGNIKKDSTWILIQLLDSAKAPVLITGYSGAKAKLSVDTIFAGLKVGPNVCRSGKFYAKGDSVYYPIVAAVTEVNRVIGYLVIWRSMISSPQGMAQLSQLLGTDATLYLGNADGSLWTNLLKPVKQPAISHQNISGFFEYNNLEDDKVIAAVQRLPNTKWLVLVEFSEQTILESANLFLRWIIIIGGIMITAGIVVTWIMSRNIIRPLNQLTAAATRIASGEYSSSIKINRMDELGKLVHAFNVMADKIQINQQELESKVKERTEQLETANREMESFSYSVSHDLRAPLRGIIGFTSILEEKYVNNLDDEAKRIAAIIKRNTIKMGDLIDDLLAFSKLGRSDISKTMIDTDDMVKEVINGLDAGQAIKWNIAPLPVIKGDMNAIRQVWINLISNAIKYSRNKEQPVINIGLAHQNGQVAFFVEDNGVGFDQKYAGKLFKVFQRLHAANEFEGTGIGLAIIEKVISKHGGKVWVEAEKDRGAKFFFEIPSS